MSLNTSLPTNILFPWDLKNEKESTTIKPILSQADENDENTTKATLSNDPSSPSLHKQPVVPHSFLWSHDDLDKPREKMDVTVIDLEGFFKGDEYATEYAAHLLREACSKHGFFHVINHGIDQKFLDEAHDRLDDFFKLPSAQKLKALKKPGSRWGFIQAHSDRYSIKLPWKETLSLPYHLNDTSNMVVDYFTSVIGTELKPIGMVYQKYCEAMNKLSLAIMELLAISLGLEQSHFKDLFDCEATSVLRCNYYPPCDDPSKVLGTGPHCDPIALTVLHQDQVGGLEVFADNKWQAVEPRPDALVLNLGDTFMALSNGVYKSCYHRAVVHKNQERKSVAFFLCPNDDKIIRSPEILNKPARIYPDFTWADFVEFTQKHYRPDDNTLQSFINWKLASNSNSTPL